MSDSGHSSVDQKYYWWVDERNEGEKEEHVHRPQIRPLGINKNKH